MCVCVSFFLSLFFFLISILYANVRNALIKKIKTKTTNVLCRKDWYISENDAF